MNKWIWSLLMLGNLSALSWWEMPPLEVREKINQNVRDIDASIPLVASVKDSQVDWDGRITPIRIYQPNECLDSSVILLIHGGAWVGGSLDTHDNLARYLCAQTQRCVVSVGYLNAPEGKFPFPLQQCYDVLEWVVKVCNPPKLAVVGDSSGGNMAAALCLMARDQKGPTIDLQVLLNPALDLSCNGVMEKQNDLLDPLRWQAYQYLEDIGDAFHPYVSPLLAKDLKGLPEAIVLLAENDDLREGGQRYADRLKESGIETLVYCQPNIGHLAGHGAKASFIAKPSLDVIVFHLRRTFKERSPK